MPPIVVAEQGPPVSAALEFLSKVTPTSDSLEYESPLLRAIKNVLRGTDSDSQNSIHTARFFTGDEAKDYELSWNAQHAVLTYSGVIMKRWCFDHEGESIQCACLGEIEQVVLPNSKSGHSAANYAMFENTTSSVNTDPGRPSFGPFHRANVERSRKDESYHEIVPCVFIFLRSIGKMYLMNGIDYTFSLPFIVRKAWPVSPHGVMMQRVLEPSEVVESETNGEEVLPTIFTLTSPFSEAAAVGHTAGILRALPNLPAALKDEEEHSTKPLRSIPPTEMIVWVSHCSVMADAQIVVTVNTKKNLLSIWHYKYIKPKDLAFGLNPGEHTKKARKQRVNNASRFLELESDLEIVEVLLYLMAL
jgi:anaphase-promoting complex subunit 1